MDVIPGLPLHTARNQRCKACQLLPDALTSNHPKRLPSCDSRASGSTGPRLVAPCILSLAACGYFRSPRPRASRRKLRGARIAAAAAGDSGPDVETQYWNEMQYWNWRDHRIRYRLYKGDTPGVNPSIVLVHGFGGSIEYWRRTAPALATAGYDVYVLDLLGLGMSDKPAGVEYSIKLWARQVTEFIGSIIPSGPRGVVLMGNSFGSLISLEAAALQTLDLRGIAMLNCAVGMNNKNIIKSPKWTSMERFAIGAILGLVDTIFKSPVLDFAFKNFATAENVGMVLKDLYIHDKGAVDDELVDAFVAPSKIPGALGVLRQIYTGEPGETPMELLDDPSFKLVPMKVIWGREDQLTPIDGAVGAYLSKLAEEQPTMVDFEAISAGHVPHDDNPEAVNEALVNWLGSKRLRRSVMM